MKSIKKLIIPIVIIITLILGNIVLFSPVEQVSQITEELKAYNHTAENMLDNVFKKDNQIILPFILKNMEQTISVEDVTEAFEKKNLTIKSITPSKIATGTQITVNQTSDVYNVLIYGDVNCSGEINLIDIQKIVKNYLNPNTDPLEGLTFMAANVSNNDDSINLIDIQRVAAFCINQLPTTLVTNEPEADPIKPSTPAPTPTPTPTPTKTVTGIEITPPTKLDYLDNEDFDLEDLDLTGGKVIIQYDSGSPKTIDMTSNMITGDVSIEGEIEAGKKQTKTITVAYTKFTKTFDINVYKESTEINKIVIETESTTKFIVGVATSEVPIKFYHKYSDNLEQEISVSAKNIDTTIATNFEIKLKNVQGKDATGEEIVKTISIKPKEKGEQTIEFKVADAAEGIDLTVSKKQSDGTIVLEKTIYVDAPVLNVANGAESINLYISETAIESNVTTKTEEDGLIYTLIPITLNGDPIKASSISDGTDINYRTDEKDNNKNVVVVIDNCMEDPTIEVSLISIKLYEELDGEPIDPEKDPDAKVAYIGIAISSEIVNAKDENGDPLFDIEKVIFKHYLKVGEQEEPETTIKLDINIKPAPESAE